MMCCAQALLTQLAGFFVAGSHCIADHAITVCTTGVPYALDSGSECQVLCSASRA